MNLLLCFCFFSVPVFDRGRYGIYSRTPFDDDDDDELIVNIFPLLLFLFIVPVFDRGRYGIYS